MGDARSAASERPTRDVRWAALLILLGATLLFLGMTNRSNAGEEEVGLVDLHNDQANSSQCGPVGAASWHFIVSPNDGTYAFVSVSLMIADVLQTFSNGELIPNGGQRDNIFVLVPDDFTVLDLSAEGSFAEITPPPDGNVKFVLSDLCNGGTETTTTTTTTTSTTTVAPTTTTTEPPTTTTTTTTSTTTTTVPDSTTTSTTIAESPTSTTTSTTVPVSTTTDPTTTTSTIVASAGPTTTAASTTTSVASTSSTTTSPPTTTSATTTSTTVALSRLPATGSGGGRVLILVGSVLTIVGFTLLIGAHTRRRPTEV